MADHFVNNFVAFEDLPEDNVFAIEVRCLDVGDEELGGVGVGASVGHGQQVRFGEGHHEILIFEFATIDGITARAISFGDVATLSHEIVDDAMESSSLVAERLSSGSVNGVFSITKLDKVLHSLGRGFPKHPEHNTACIHPLYLDVEKDAFSDFS